MRSTYQCVRTSGSIHLHLVSRDFVSKLMGEKSTNLICVLKWNLLLPLINYRWLPATVPHRRAVASREVSALPTTWRPRTDPPRQPAAPPSRLKHGATTAATPRSPRFSTPWRNTFGRQMFQQQHHQYYEHTGTRLWGGTEATRKRRETDSRVWSMQTMSTWLYISVPCTPHDDFW